MLLRHSDSTPVITDFGVSHEIREGTFTRQLITTGRVPIGTLQWMAPELLTHESGKEVVYTKEADIWSFGMTIYVRLALFYNPMLKRRAGIGNKPRSVVSSNEHFCQHGRATTKN